MRRLHLTECEVCVRPISEPITPTAERRGGAAAEELDGGPALRTFTCVVYLKPERLFRPAYKVGGATPVLPGVFLCHVGQFQLSEGLRLFTDKSLQREN